MKLPERAKAPVRTEFVQEALEIVAMRIILGHAADGITVELDSGAGQELFNTIDPKRTSDQFKMLLICLAPFEGIF